MEAVRSLGYEPNEVARSLRGGRTNLIGVIFPQIVNPYFSRCVQQIELETTRFGASVILLTHQEDPVKQSRQLEVLRRSQCDGVILTAAPNSDPVKLKRELGTMPVVALDRPIWDDGDVVMLQHRQAAREATLHLLEHGIKEIACATTDPNIYSFQERILGYEEVMRQAGQKSHVIVAGDYGALQDAVHASLLEPPRLGGLIALSNMATVSAMLAIREIHQIQPPKVALIGFDDVDLAILVEPAITVMVQPVDRMARETVNLLFRLIGSGRDLPPQRIMPEAELIRRNSCGCL